MQVNYQTQYRSTIILLLGLLILSMTTIFCSISLGSVDLKLTQLLHTLMSPSQTIPYTIFIKLRLPRTLCAFLTGGMLALSGALMQTLLRNPLADPYVLGVSGGAAVATLIGILLGISSHFLNLFAFIGSFFTIVIVMTLAHNKNGLSSLRLLLSGIVIATGWAALISFILTVSPEHALKSMLFWLMGDLSYAEFSIWQPIVLILALTVTLSLAKPLNILTRGDLTAQSLGINTRRLNMSLYFISSILTAYAVNIAGCIGFVGLIVPHMLRLLHHSDHRFLLPASVLLGGTLLTLADTLGRTLLSPVQLPVGIVTAIIGVPLFLILLQRGYKQ